MGPLNIKLRQYHGTCIYNIYINIKLQNINFSQTLQKMHSGNYIYNKKNVFELFRNVPTVRMSVGIVGLCCTINGYFENRIRIRCI